ncbi:MAG TPA: glycosyltransferase [Microlunatus sp.]
MIMTRERLQGFLSERQVRTLGRMRFRVTRLAPAARAARRELTANRDQQAADWQELPRLQHEVKVKREQLAAGRERLQQTRDRLQGTRARLLTANERIVELRTMVQGKRRAEGEVRRFAHAYRRLLSAGRGVASWQLDEQITSAPDLHWDKPFVAEVRSLAQDAAVARLIRQGKPLDEAVATVTRQLRWVDNADWRAFCHALAADPSTRTAGTVGAALVAERLGQQELVWQLLSSLSDEDAARLAAAEYLRAGLEAHDDHALPVAAGWIAGRRVTDPQQLLQLARLFFVAEEPAIAQTCLDQAEAIGDLDDQLAASLEYLRPWIQRKLAPQQPAPVPAGHVVFGVIDYKQPDEQAASSNIGDYVQTIASLGHLLRHDGVRLHGDDDLVGVARFLQDRVRPDHRIPGPEREVTLALVQRDASQLDALPPNTWTLAFGWYMHSQFGLHWDFPFHPSVNPIFISFHCNKTALLTPDVVDYLRSHGPIGCRDWTTVHLLLNAGVPAFFSGCITTTIDTLFGEDLPQPPAGAPVAYVDVSGPRPADAIKIQQASPLIRTTPAAQNVKEAVALLESYRSEYSTVITSRLHCYLPSWSIGANVEFRPRNRADIRFAGLLDADAGELIMIQQRIRTLLAPVIGRVLAGADAEEVYALWREVCADEVEHARQVHQTPAARPTTSLDVAAACRAVAATRVVIEPTRPRSGEVINIAVGLDGNLRDQLATVICGMVDNTERPIRLHALTRDHGPDDHERLARLFPEVGFEWYACDGVEYGPVLRMLKHITVATMDRLLLPDLLAGVDRVIYHDIDALAVADLGALYDIELAGAPPGRRPRPAIGTACPRCSRRPGCCMTVRRRPASSCMR